MDMVTEFTYLVSVLVAGHSPVDEVTPTWKVQWAWCRVDVDHSQHPRVAFSYLGSLLGRYQAMRRTCCYISDLRGWLSLVLELYWVLRELMTRWPRHCVSVEVERSSQGRQVGCKCWFWRGWSPALPFTWCKENIWTWTRQSRDQTEIFIHTFESRIIKLCYESKDRMLPCPLGVLIRASEDWSLRSVIRSLETTGSLSYDKPLPSLATRSVISSIGRFLNISTSFDTNVCDDIGVHRSRRECLP